MNTHDVRTFSSTTEFAKNREDLMRQALRAVQGLGLVFAVVSLLAAALGLPGPWALMASLTVFIVALYVRAWRRRRKIDAEARQSSAQGFVISFDEDDFTYVKTRIPWSSITDVVVGDTRKEGPFGVGEMGAVYLRIAHTTGDCRTRIADLLPSAVASQMLVELKRRADKHGFRHRTAHTRREYKKLLGDMRKPR